MSSPEDIIIHTIHTIRDTTFYAANVLDSQIDSLASKLRSHLANSSWLPQSYRPSPPQLPPSLSPPNASLVSIFLSPTRLYHTTCRWARHNKLLATTLFTTITIGTAYTTHNILSRRNRKKLKRRAVRASNGARTQVVLLSGYHYEQITSLLALDLERRGFIVYIIVHTPEEESAVLREVGAGRPDIRPLMLDLASPEAQIERFTNWLSAPQCAFEGAGKGGRYHLNLAGLVIVPMLASYPAAPVEVLDGGIWSDTINLNLLQPIIVARNFLRPLALFKSRLIILQSVIVPSLAPPFCALETVVGRGTEAWASVLEREVSPFGVGVTLIKVGNVEGIVNAHQNPRQQHQQQYGYASGASSTGSSRHRTPSPNTPPVPPNARADVLSWPASLRQSYGRQFISSVTYHPSSVSAGPAVVKGAPMRELFLTVFDALGGGLTPGAERPKGRFVYRVGTGSRVYEVLGEWLPRGIVGWMLGIEGWGTVEVGKESRRGMSGLIGHGGVEEEESGKGKEREGGGGDDGGARDATSTPEWEKVDRLV